jgi:hypothetical protein
MLVLLLQWPAISIVSFFKISLTQVLTNMFMGTSIITTHNTTKRITKSPIVLCVEKMEEVPKNITDKSYACRFLNPQTDESSPALLHSTFKSNFNIMLPSTPNFSKWSSTFRFSVKTM